MVKEEFLTEYPRPQFKRASFISLNGKWNYAIRKDRDFVTKFDGEILVPYCIESRLSGVQKFLKKNEFLHYQKLVEIPKNFNKGIVLLNFQAVDQICHLYINKKYVKSHVGGYLPFSFDITPYIDESFKQQEIYLVVQDDVTSGKYARGKQSENPKGIWYTQTTGIWQSVFLESVPKNYISKFDISCDYDKGEVHFEYKSKEIFKDLKVKIKFNKKEITTLKPKEKSFSYHFRKFESWTPENPNLYDVIIDYPDDHIETYFGMRKFSIIKNKERKNLFALNNKPILLSGVLDQGYFKDGIYTPSSYSQIENDILTMKKMGFNMLRKHIKIELPYFYYYCDKYGMIVWQDFVSGGNNISNFYWLVRPFLKNTFNDFKYKKLGRINEDSCKQFLKEMKETVDYLKSTTCICGWTIFNESWGQFRSKECSKYLRTLDNTRIIDSTSGWYDTYSGDCISRHFYFQKIKFPQSYYRVAFLSETGGFRYPIGHTKFKKKGDNIYYKVFHSKEELENAFSNLYLKSIKRAIIKDGLSGIVYTQLSDVEDEVNGFLTYDRKTLKVNPEKISEVNSEIQKEFALVNKM